MQAQEPGMEKSLAGTAAGGTGRGAEGPEAETGPRAEQRQGHVLIHHGQQEEEEVICGEGKARNHQRPDRRDSLRRQAWVSSPWRKGGAFQESLDEILCSESRDPHEGSRSPWEGKRVLPLLS